MESNENREIFTLIWLDSSVEAMGAVQQQLRSIINYMKIFDNIDTCEQYIRSLTKNDRLVMVINAELAHQMIKRVHPLEHVIAIYIYSVNLSNDHQWINEYTKIKSIKENLDELITPIKSDQIKRRMLEVPLPISVFDPTQVFNRLFTNTNSSFLYSQLVIHFLLQTKLTDEQMFENQKELLNQCKTDYGTSLHHTKILHEFEYDYLSGNALWWYTLDSFLFQILNKALNQMTIDRLYLLQFFIHDVVRQLKQHQSSSIERVYRSYLLSPDDLQVLEESVGKYLSINTFFSTFLNRNSALDCLTDENNSTRRKVLFRIDADPRSTKIKPFANITVHSQNTNEEEILFALGSIFHLKSIQLDKNQVHTIHLVLCSDDDASFRSIFDHIKHQYGENDVNLLTFGTALKRLGKLDEAEKCYQRLLNDRTYDRDAISRSYHYLGRLAEAKGDYDISLECLHKSLDLKFQLMKSNDPSIAQSYNCIGLVHQQKGDQEKALEAFEKALVIWRRAYGRNHPNVAGCYNNMGVVYKREKKYNEALESFGKALEIREKHHSTNYHDLAGSHNNIGAVYERLGHHDLAIEHYNLSLKIKSKALPPHHPSIGSTLENMGYVYEIRGAYLQALSYLEKAAMIYRQSLPPTHHDVIQIEESIERVSSKL